MLCGWELVYIALAGRNTDRLGWKPGKGVFKRLLIDTMADHGYQVFSRRLLVPIKPGTQDIK